MMTTVSLVALFIIFSLPLFVLIKKIIQLKNEKYLEKLPDLRDIRHTIDGEWDLIKEKKINGWHVYTIEIDLQKPDSLIVSETKTFKTKQRLIPEVLY